MSGTDRVIRVSTAVAVLGVAGVAAYVSYWHAYEVVRAHGESGVTARIEPATIDGLVYSSSMVILYAARHRLPVPGLARWLLALGVVVTLAANVAHGWSSGPVGAVVAAWPAASLVGSYELLLWLIRTAAAGAAVREPIPGQSGEPPGQPVTTLRLVSAAGPGGPCGNGQGCPLQVNGPQGVNADQVAGPAWAGAEPPLAWADQESGPADRLAAAAYAPGREDINAVAVAAYRDSIDDGSPLSERRLAAMFGKTSRRWARNRMDEARRTPAPEMAASP